MHRSSAALLLAALALGACAPRRFVCPARGERPWRELTSEHVSLRTDLDREAGARIIHELELMRALVLKGMFNRVVESPERLEVVAFATRAEFDELTGATGVLGLHRRDAFGRQLILLPGGLRREQTMVVAHELAYLLSFRFIRRQPRSRCRGARPP